MNFLPLPFHGYYVIFKNRRESAILDLIKKRENHKIIPLLPYSKLDLHYTSPIFTLLNSKVGYDVVFNLAQGITSEVAKNIVFTSPLYDIIFNYFYFHVFRKIFSEFKLDVKGVYRSKEIFSFIIALFGFVYVIISV